MAIIITRVYYYFRFHYCIFVRLLMTLLLRHYAAADYYAASSCHFRWRVLITLMMPIRRHYAAMRHY